MHSNNNAPLKFIISSNIIIYIYVFNLPTLEIGKTIVFI